MFSLLASFFFVVMGLHMASGMPQQLSRRFLITSELILACVPASASCDGAPKPDECRTSGPVASAISTAFEQYQIINVGEQAALISLMGFESGDFKYQNNYFPGSPGQGSESRVLISAQLTAEARNMQSAAFNIQYAQYLGLVPAGTSVEPDQFNQVRSLLTSDDVRDFGSSAWFLTQQCLASVRSALQDGSQASWEGYLTGCVGTPVTPERLAYWQRAVQALGGI